MFFIITGVAVNYRVYEPYAPSRADESFISTLCHFFKKNASYLYIERRLMLICHHFYNITKNEMIITTAADITFAAMLSFAEALSTACSDGL